MNIQELFLKQTRLTEITTLFIVVKAVPFLATPYPKEVLSQKSVAQGHESDTCGFLRL